MVDQKTKPSCSFLQSTANQLSLTICPVQDNYLQLCVAYEKSRGQEFARYCSCANRVRWAITRPMIKSNHVYFRQLSAYNKQKLWRKCQIYCSVLYVQKYWRLSGSRQSTKLLQKWIPGRLTFWRTLDIAAFTSDRLTEISTWPCFPGHVCGSLVAIV